MPTDYDDDYATCSKTYASLRIYHDDLDPDRITGLLGIQPSQTQIKGRGYTKPSGELELEIGFDIYGPYDD